MNKQQKTYGLLIAVLVIWGVIGYRIYIRLNPSTPELEVFTVQSTFKKQRTVETSFYEVNAEYRDPFLGKFPKKKVTTKKTVKPKQTIPFPNVIYNGVIQGNTSKTYILTINGKQELVKLGQELESVKLLSANKRQAVVKFQGVKKTIVLQ
jgi:hypothetical protein